MSRMQTYRQRIPTHIIQLLDVASRITLFQVGQSGPLCFTFKDRLQNKYKTSIGAEVKCTCNSNRNDHCIHSIYVLLKIFRVSVENPIIWQAAYVDSELSDLVAGKHSVAATRRIVRPLYMEETQMELPSEYISKRKEEYRFKMEEPKAQRLPLDEDSVCPICQDSMNDTMCLSYCRVKCGNNFHLECLKVWARHKNNEQAKMTCPMCRTQLGNDYLYQLDQQQREFKKKQSDKVVVMFDCAGCGVKGIPTNPHKCLLCTGYELCECCYAAGKHIKHPFIRRGEDLRWRGAQERRENQLKIKNFIEKKKKETVNEQLLAKLRKIEEDPNKLIDYLASSYPYVSKYISENIDPYKKLQFDPTDIRCLKCGATKMLFLRRLPCGHFIDHECLKSQIVKEHLHCPQDGMKLLKGWENLTKKQKQIEREKTKKEFQGDRQFDPKHLQPSTSHSIPYQYNFASQQLTLTQVLSGRRPSDSDHSSLLNNLANNIVRNAQRPPSQSNARPASRETPHQPPRPRQIRIRQVGQSVGGRNQERSLPPKRDRRNNMQGIIQTLIGRKMK